MQPKNIRSNIQTVKIHSFIPSSIYSIVFSQGTWLPFVYDLFPLSGSSFEGFKVANYYCLVHWYIEGIWHFSFSLFALLV